jgi:hypothetical protein
MSGAERIGLSFTIVFVAYIVAVVAVAAVVVAVAISISIFLAAVTFNPCKRLIQASDDFVVRAGALRVGLLRLGLLGWLRVFRPRELRQRHEAFGLVDGGCYVLGGGYALIASALLQQAVAVPKKACLPKLARFADAPPEGVLDQSMLAISVTVKLLLLPDKHQQLAFWVLASPAAWLPTLTVDTQLILSK